MKTGGYQWAGGWIDPSVPLAGYKEHPTMSVADSEKKFELQRKSWAANKVQRALYYAAQGDSY
jgi:hypothetical protein